MSDSRVVIALYRPRSGRAGDLDRVVARHWRVLRDERLVTARAPYVMRSANGTVLEVFEWTSPEAIERAHANAVVQALWAEFGEACEYVSLSSLPEAAAPFPEFTSVGTP